MSVIALESDMSVIASELDMSVTALDSDMSSLIYNMTITASESDLLIIVPTESPVVLSKCKTMSDISDLVLITF